MIDVILKLQEMGFNMDDFYAITYYSTVNEMNLQGSFKAAIAKEMLNKQGVPLAMTSEGFAEGRIKIDGLTIRVVLT